MRSTTAAALLLAQLLRVPRTQPLPSLDELMEIPPDGPEDDGEMSQETFLVVAKAMLGVK